MGSDNENKEWNEKQNEEWNSAAESLMVEYYSIGSDCLPLTGIVSDNLDN